MEIDEKEQLRRENHFLREKIEQLNDQIENYQKYIEEILRKLEKHERDLDLSNTFFSIRNKEMFNQSIFFKIKI